MAEKCKTNPNSENKITNYKCKSKNILGYYRNLGSLRYGNKYWVERRCMGKTNSSSSTEAYFNHAVITARWLVHLGLKMNQSTTVASEPMAIQPAIACQNGRGVWLYNQPIIRSLRVRSLSRITLVLRRETLYGNQSNHAMLRCGMTRNQNSRGIRPGESVEYTKHRVSLEGHPWLGVIP